ncbi:hypothetical protein K7432_012632 [Basidiobolus ranarum]|uniref:Uncharacterized protein n=1 Tax=Basidiobolus ranarum TaxID=34480 RepID=A0ABR2WKM1_9FUNG
MGGEEDGNSLGSLLGLFKSPTGRNNISNIPNSNNFLSTPQSPVSTTLTSKILDELRYRNISPTELEKLPRRRTIHFGKLPTSIQKPLETTIPEESTVTELAHETEELKSLQEQLKQQQEEFELRERNYREEIKNLREHRDRNWKSLESTTNSLASLSNTTNETTQSNISTSPSPSPSPSLLPTNSLNSQSISTSYLMEMEDLKREKESLQQHLNIATNQLKSYENSLKNLFHQHTETQNRLESLEVEKKDLEIRGVENEIAYLDLEEERDELITKCDQLNQLLRSQMSKEVAIGTMSKMVDSLRLQYTDLQQESEQLQANVTAQEEKKSSLSKELSVLLMDVKSLETEIGASKEEHAKKTEEKESLAAQMLNKIAKEEELKREMDLLEANHETLEQQYVNLQKSIEELNEVLSRESERIDTLQEDRRSLAEEIDVLIEVNEELRSKAEFWRNSVKEVESEFPSSLSVNSKHSNRNSNGNTFVRIQKIYEQRLTDQEHRFNRLWDDIVINNEHLQNENQNLQFQLGDLGNDRDSWANYANELESRVEASPRESEQTAESNTLNIDHNVKAEKEKADSWPHLDSVTADFQRKIDGLERDRQELIDYARKLEYEVDNLTQELQHKDSSSRRHSQSLAPLTPSESVNQESLLPYTPFQNGTFPENGSKSKNTIDNTFPSTTNFETEGFASLFADIDQMRDEMMKLSQLNTRLQEDCHTFKTDRDRLATEIHRLVDENSALVDERKDILAAARREPKIAKRMFGGDLIKDPRFLELMDKINSLEINLDNQYQVNEKLKRQVTGDYSARMEDKHSTSESEHAHSTDSPNSSSSDSIILSKELVNSLLAQTYAVKQMLETDSLLLTEIQITLSPDSAESTRASDVVSEDSKSSTKPIDRDQITRLFTSLKSLIKNQSSLIGNVQEIINKLHHPQNATVSPTSVNSSQPNEDHSKSEYWPQLCEPKRRDREFNEGSNTPKYENPDLFTKMPPRLHRRQSAFDTRSEPAQMYQLSRNEARSLQQDFHELERRCHDLKHEKDLLIQENEQYRRKLHEVHEKNNNLRQRSLMMENLESKIRDLIQIKDEEYTMSTDKICQLEYDLQSKMNKIMALTREKNLILQDNNELQRKLIMLNEAKRQWEVDFQSEKEMSNSFQNQLRALKDSLRVEQHEKRTKISQILRLETIVAEKTEECQRLQSRVHLLQETLNSPRRNTDSSSEQVSI